MKRTETPAPKRSRHRHRFARSSESLNEYGYLCPCGERKSRRTSAREKKAFLRRSRKLFAAADDLHRLIHAWHKVACDRDGGYKVSGWMAIQKARRFAKKHPEVRLVGVDDALFASSDLMFVPSYRKGFYMGATVVYLPQCTGERPVEFFLYPHHQKSLAAALRAEGLLRRTCRPKRKPRNK